MVDHTQQMPFRITASSFPVHMCDLFCFVHSKHQLECVITGREARGAAMASTAAVSKFVIILHFVQGTVHIFIYILVLDIVVYSFMVLSDHYPEL